MHSIFTLHQYGSVSLRFTFALSIGKTHNPDLILTCWQVASLWLLAVGTKKPGGFLVYVQHQPSRTQPRRLPVQPVIECQCRRVVEVGE